MTEYEKIMQSLECVNDARENYLKAHGWRHSSEKNPACIWLWSNEALELNGCTTSIAWAIQGHTVR